MRIIYWQYFFTPPGGWGNRRSYDFARYWTQKGHEVWIIAGGTYFPPSLIALLGKRRCFRTREGIPIIFLANPYHQKQKSLQRLLSFFHFTFWSAYILFRLRRLPFLLVATLPPPFLPFLAAMRNVLTGKPFILEMYDAWPQVPQAMGFIPSFLKIPLYKLSIWSYKKAALVIGLSPDIVKLFPLPQIVLSYNGTRPEVFRRRRYPSFLPFRVIYAGTFGKVNHLDFLLAVAEVLKLYRSIEFWLVGDGKERPLIEQKAQRLPQVKVFPPVPVEEVPYWLSEAHVGVSTVLPLPILASNSANKFYDYLANGLVVGINYRGWQAEFLEEYHCGFSALTPKEFAEYIEYYYWHRDIWERATCHARKAAEKFFDRRRLSQELLKKFAEVGCSP
ncbi:MAG: glycosyltransferase family 4 protein [Bacteroidia bacterium]|nr:glycosyltransferase family 4 protein [Bacteroidia bacterium]